MRVRTERLVSPASLPADRTWEPGLLALYTELGLADAGQRTPSSSLTRLIRSATSADASRSSANLRSIMKPAQSPLPFHTILGRRSARERCTPRHGLDRHP